jgi:hypothetical protein
LLYTKIILISLGSLGLLGLYTGIGAGSTGIDGGLIILAITKLLLH